MIAVAWRPPAVRFWNTLAIDGMRHPPEPIGRPWSDTERRSFAMAAEALSLVLNAELVDLDRPRVAAMLVVHEARNRLLDAMPGCWPVLPDKGFPAPLDLSLPILWGLRHLRRTLGLRPDACSAPIQAVDAIVAKANGRMRAALDVARMGSAPAASDPQITKTLDELHWALRRFDKASSAPARRPIGCAPAVHAGVLVGVQTAMRHTLAGR